MIEKCFRGIYRNKRVLLTGHTGFKGSWAALWLKEMGANVTGYALALDTDPSHFILLNSGIKSVIADIRDRSKLEAVFAECRPDIVFHMAAQPLVRYSYQDPHGTFETNVMGTVNVFEAARKTPGVKAIVNVTSDKCYENREWVWGYRENEAMGGYDPYSASKGCSELVTASYQRAFFNTADYGKKHNTLLASCRAGNVIGGGDWAQDRLIPDIMRAVSKKEIVPIRSPRATRPWQHVLEPVSGYLLVGQRLLEGNKDCTQAWNFGPSEEGELTVETVLRRAQQAWGDIKYEIKEDPNNPHEANYLKLDCSKAHIKLKWKSVWDSKETITRTIDWYRKFYADGRIESQGNLESYVKDAHATGIIWA